MEMSELETISELMRDIAAFRNVIAYFEGRILRKQIAIEEIAHSSEARKELNSELVKEETVTLNGSAKTMIARNNTVAGLVRGFVAVHPTERTFLGRDVCAWIKQEHPERRKLQPAVNLQLRQLVRLGFWPAIRGENTCGPWRNESRKETPCQFTSTKTTPPAK